MDNYFFPVYKNIENEVRDLSYSIHISDDNVDVYSLRIADIIIRCSIELESIAKSIYRKNTGCADIKENSNGDIIRWLDANFQISQKAVSIVSDNIYITSSEFVPFLALLAIMIKTSKIIIRFIAT